MRKKYNYILPIIFGVGLITLICLCYFLYEVKHEMASGVLAPIGVCLLFAAQYPIELLLVKKRKYGFAIALSAIKYALVFFGLTVVFRHTLAGFVFLLILALIPGIGWALLITFFAKAAYMLLIILIIQIGIVVEPVLLYNEKKSLIVKPQNLRCDL